MVCSYRNQLIDLQLTNQSSCFSIRRTLIANELIVENEIRWLKEKKKSISLLKSFASS